MKRIEHKNRNDKIISLYRKGMTFKEVANTMNLSRGVVSGVVTRYQAKWGKVRRNMRRAGD